MVSRSPAETKSIMPPTANSVSGKTSVVTRPARVAAASCGDPGMVAPCGVKESPVGPLEKRSPIVRTARAVSSNRLPHRKSVGPSTTIEPDAVEPLVPLDARTTATNPATRPRTVTAIWLA